MKPTTEWDDQWEALYQGCGSAWAPKASDQAILETAIGCDARRLPAGDPSLDPIRQIIAETTPAGMQCWILGWTDEVQLGLTTCFFEDGLTVPPEELVLEKYRELHSRAAKKRLH